ncbi:uncharacterized protein [Montipora foliosa]|uniref:uncharacterized protein n=1 Tax=Montipora foliosa TaxID=591990 RepID=UPI0035F1738C
MVAHKKIRRSTKNIVILKPDKGNGVVVLDRADYDQGILKIISDTSKFRPIKEDPTLLREGRSQRLLRKLKKNGHLDSDVYNSIYPRGSQPARIYGFPKMLKERGHNSIPPFRPIVSSIGTYNYNLAKYLYNLLTPHIPTEHCASDTFTFVRDIQGLSMHGKFMVSFDIVSLFTNIPLEECIDLAVKYISDGDPDIKLSNTELKSLFSVATVQTHFLFKGSFYDQIDGVAMGYPLAPVLSNLFMGHHEKLWLENFQDSEILFYRRYVDDTFCLFHSENQALLFFNYINSRHPNIRFNMEKETDHKIPFLDVLINIGTHFPDTSVYRRKAFTGL